MIAELLKELINIKMRLSIEDYQDSSTGYSPDAVKNKLYNRKRIIKKKIAEIRRKNNDRN